MPENARPGEAFDVVATIAPSKDGTFSIAALDGMPMPTEEAPETGEMEEAGEMEEGGEMEGEMEGGTAPATPVNERNDASKIKLPF